MSRIISVMKPVCWFVGGFWRNCVQWFLEGLGRVRIYDRPFWFVFNPKPFGVRGRHIRNALGLLRPGDVLVRAYDTYLSSWFIPGRFSHSGLYVGRREGDLGADTVVHALGTGVQKTDVLDFLMACDAFAILRPQCDDGTKEKACRIAEGYIGAQYDYRFDICEDYDNEGEVDQRTKSVYCHELTRSCYPHLRIDPLCPSLWNGMIRSSKKQFLAQSFIDSPDFKVVYDSFYSHMQAG